MPKPGFWGLCTKCLYDESIVAQSESEARGASLGRSFGDYELVRPLGRGGMGVVYEAIQVSLGRRVALKMILDAEGASPIVLRRFTLEAETVARLDHPNIVPLYQIGEVNGQPFLSMKLISGETLRKKIAEGEIGLNRSGGREQSRDELSRIAQLVIKVANAVEHAHQSGIIHRDLKPGNILVDDSGEPHLLDFGLAKILQTDSNADRGVKTEPLGTPGTPGYMSPEQAQGKPLTVASDVHSLGAILYEMLCGALPFGGETPIEVLKNLIEREPPRPRALNPRIDKDIDTICMKCLEKTPGARYPGAGALAQDLNRWLCREPISARPAGISLRVTRWVARNRAGSALIASLCVGLAVALLLLGQALDRQRKLDLRRANSLQVFSAGIEEMWKDPQKRSISITSSTLADIADFSPRLNDPLSIRLILGNAINHEPFGEAQQYAPFLHELEARLEKLLSRSVLIDLKLYKLEENALTELQQGTLHFQRMPAVAYVLAKRKAPGLLPLVRENKSREGVIFASRDSAITNLAGVRGKRLALGQTTGDYAFWGKVYLARAGVVSSSLRSCAYMHGAPEERGTLPSEKQVPDRDPQVQAHRRVVSAVLKGEADVGVVPRRQFELLKYKKHGLVELCRFTLGGEIYASSPGLPQEVGQALQQALLSFSSVTDKAVLGRLGASVSPDGFEKIRDEDFAAIRTALEKEIAKFEQTAE